jgi:amino acid transporter
MHPDIEPSPLDRARKIVFGPPRNLKDRNLFHHLSLVPFLAWVGLGADGLSSSSYGPQEAFLAISGHEYLAVGLALATIATVAVIAFAYSRIIERFPSGGGGYLVATKLLGAPAGVVSGNALLVDYVLTITVSIAAAGDALFSFLPPDWVVWKMPVEVGLIAGMTTLNIRGVRESIMPLVPVFLLFVATHLALIVAGIWQDADRVPAAVVQVSEGWRSGVAVLGVGGMAALFARAFSLGGGTYTGIEAVSNGMPILREPRVASGRRTMLYMAVSLSFTAGGLLLCYLLWDVHLVEGQTLNAVLSEAVFSTWPGGRAIAVATLVSEGALLVVAGQAGFLDGPRVLANMALDGWMPRRFGALSDRLTSRNGILLMGGASLVVLLYAQGSVSSLVVMYSINVFLTFSLSMAGMLRASIFTRDPARRSVRSAVLFALGLAVCATILVVTSIEKFAEGGWLTLLVTGLFTAMSFLIHRHYRRVGACIARLDNDLTDLQAPAGHAVGRPDPDRATAAILVGGYGGLGVATVLHVLRTFRGHYRSLLFVSAGVVDSGAFKGADELDALRESTRRTVDRYVDLARRLGLPAEARVGVGTDAVDELERLCVAASKNHRDITFFAGRLAFRRERWYHGWLHNETAHSLQRRLESHGITLVVLPRLVDKRGKGDNALQR